MTAVHEITERRAAERIPLAMNIVVHFTYGQLRWTESASLLVDLSSRGMFIRCERVPREGQPVLVGLLHKGRGLCAAWGKTVRFDGMGGFGVEFKRINNPLSDFVGELSEVAAEERGAIMARALDARVWIDVDDPF